MESIHADYAFLKVYDYILKRQARLEGGKFLIEKNCTRIHKFK